VTRDDPYPYELIEEDFIQFILEKVVMLRELPFMQQQLNFERAQYVERLQQSKFNASHLKGNFATKPLNRRGINL
jgi:hypothetical protein